MANGVWHTGLKTILELDKDDLGLEGHSGIDTADLIAELLQPVAGRDRRLLMCVETSSGRRCKAEASGVQSPYMYVRKHRGPDGVLRLRAAHLPTTHTMTAEESDLHKALKEFMARTADDAGLEVHVEKATKARTSRPDVTIVGAGGVSLGCEAQLYNASPSTVLRRSRAHADAGLTANWITPDSQSHLIDRANWMLINQVTWKQVVNAADLPLAGGYRILAEWHCVAAAERPCPDGLSKTGCGKTHLHWDTPARTSDEGIGWTSHEGNAKKVTVGQTLVGAATGTVTPLFLPSRSDRRFGNHLWVPLKDRERWAEYRGDSKETAPAEDAVDPDDAIHFSGQDADLECRFGEETWVPSAPLKQRGLDSVELFLTVDQPPLGPAAQAEPVIPAQRSEEIPLAPVMPPTLRMTRGECETGQPRCGQKARLYPAGWRCDEHRPGRWSRMSA